MSTSLVAGRYGGVMSLQSAAESQGDASDSLVLEERVLAELLAARKAAWGLSPTGMAACPTMTGLLGDGDPLLAFTRLQARVLELIDQDDDVLPVQAAAYSLGLACARSTHLDRLSEFGADFGFEARQARRYSDRGLRQLARLICSNWLVQTAPLCRVVLAQRPDGAVTVMAWRRWQWFVGMRSIAVQRLDADGQVMALEPKPVFTQPADPLADPGLLWLDSRLEHPLRLPAPEPGRDVCLRISWPGEVWPQFSTTMVGPLAADCALTSQVVGNTTILTIAALG